MRYITTIIIGAGQSGLAMSKHLTERSIDHVLFERGEVANSWNTERWDSLRLLTPNWQSRLPCYRYSGDDPHGYMRVVEVVDYLKTYANLSGAPVLSRTKVTRVRRIDSGYEVMTDQGIWRCRALVIASGACNIANMPDLAAEMPRQVVSRTPTQYRNPEALPEGCILVVGASATGVQLAREIRASGRPVILAAGEHVRVPRTYRGQDVKWWMDVMGAMDLRYDALDDIDRARRLPSLQLIGSPGRETIDLNSLRKAGVEIVGRVAGMRDGVMQFSASLPNHCALADLKMKRLLKSIDNWVSEADQQERYAAPEEFEPTAVNTKPLSLNMNDGEVKAVIWATGYRPDYSWLDVPVFDRKGRIRHDGGVVDAPGMYVMGLPFMRRRKSSFIDGAGDDAADLAAHLSLTLRRAAA